MRKTAELRQALTDLDLFSHPAPSLFLHLNPYADLFFSKCPTIPHPLPRCSKQKSPKKTPPSSNRQQVLSWYHPNNYDAALSLYGRPASFY